MGDSTWNWKSTTKVDGLKAQHEVTSIPRKMSQLRATKIPLDMPSTQLLCKATFKSRNWLDNIPHVGALSGWDREGKILVWVDNGNSWTPLNQKGHMPDAARVLDEYRQIAMLLPRMWEKSIFDRADKSIFLAGPRCRTRPPVNSTSR